MVIDLVAEKPNRLSFGVGDVLVFYNGKEYDFHQVLYDNRGGTFRLLALEHSKINDSWNSLLGMIEDLNKVKNEFNLIEVLSPDEVVIRRVANE